MPSTPSASPSVSGGGAADPWRPQPSLARTASIQRRYMQWPCFACLLWLGSSAGLGGVHMGASRRSGPAHPSLSLLLRAHSAEGYAAGAAHPRPRVWSLLVLSVRQRRPARKSAPKPRQQACEHVTLRLARRAALEHRQSCTMAGRQAGSTCTIFIQLHPPLLRPMTVPPDLTQPWLSPQHCTNPPSWSIKHTPHPLQHLSSSQGAVARALTCLHT